MKIGVLSDLHIDTNRKKLNRGDTYDRLLAQLLYNNEIDLLLMAGDISSDYQDSIQFLDQMVNHRVSKLLFVPGNHDFWSIRNKDTDTERIYQTFLQREDSPVGKPLLLNDKWSVVGNPGWYDYGFASQSYTTEQFEQKKLRIGGWNDRLYVHWKQSDQEVAEAMRQQLEVDCQSVDDRQIILMTHIVTHPQFTVPLPHRVYDYYNAFLGSKSYMSLYEDYPIRHSVMGHVHFRKSMKEDEIAYYCQCLGNGRHWWSDDPYTELASTLETFIIE